MKQVRKVYIAKPEGPHARRSAVLRHLGFLVVASVIVGGAFGGGGLWWLSRDLPKIAKLSDYRPYVLSYVYDRDGNVIGQFKYENQNRILVGMDEIPKTLVDAVVSAEDQNFFVHKGVDLGGIVRAAFANVRAGEISQGASTITMQLTRALLLTPEKTIRRKVREMILAHRIESNLTKEEILNLYLNEIYFGSGAYGVQAAARIYFGKDVRDLSLAECAVLAGLPQAPSRYSPRHNPEEADRRRRYVLERMVEDGRVTPEEGAAAAAEQTALVEPEDINLKYAPYPIEHVRRYMMETYGPDKVFRGGLHIYTTIDLEKQRAAQKAVDKGLRELDQRQGWRGPAGHLAPEEVPAWLARRRGAARGVEPEKGSIHEAVVTAIDSKNGRATVDTGAFSGTIALADMRWAQTTIAGGRTRSIRLTDPRQLLNEGDLVEVQVLEKNGTTVRLGLDQKPKVQGALVAINPRTFEVEAMVGGNDFRTSQFNRAVQAARQPGSAFKPIIYSAALDAGFTPASVILDTALVFADGWKPKNYGGRFQGRMRLRQALAKSVNTVTVRLLGEIGTTYALDYARRLGVPLGASNDLSMALGSYEVTPWDLTKVYAVFASGGLQAEPILISRIVDANGRLVEQRKLAETPEAFEGPSVEPGIPDANWVTQGGQADGAPADGAADWMVAGEDPIAPPDGAPSWNRVTGEVKVRRVMSRQTAYVLTTMLQSVVREGTGARALALGKVAAGKTGTTNDNVDAWFLGFTPTHLAGVWVGFDEGGRTLGAKETGARAALPIWLYYMKDATRKDPDRSFSMPPGVVVARIDPETGLLASPGTDGAITEFFKAGTAPTEFASAAQRPRGNDFFRFDEEAEDPVSPDLPNPSRIP